MRGGVGLLVTALLNNTTNLTATNDFAIAGQLDSTSERLAKKGALASDDSHKEERPLDSYF